MASTFLSRLAGAGVTPNFVSYVGLALALAAAYCFALGAGHVLPWESAQAPASWWGVAGGILLGLSALADILDGPLARANNLTTPFGAVLDSTLDRFGDMAVLIGCAVYFGALANVTYILVTCLAMSAGTQVSYVKARAESLTSGLGVGFWQRPERTAALILGGLLGRVPVVLCVLAIFPMFTVLRRVLLAYRLLGNPQQSRLEKWLDESAPWTQRRYSVPYFATCLVIAVAIVGLPTLHPFFYGSTDPLRAILRIP